MKNCDCKHKEYCKTNKTEETCTLEIEYRHFNSDKIFNMSWEQIKNMQQKKRELGGGRMERTQAIIQGIKKPCEHEFNCFQVYKFEFESIQYSNNTGKAVAQMICKTGKKRKNKRWLADCPVCGKMWLADMTKKGIIADIKAMDKKYKIISVDESVRKGGIKQ